MKYLIYAVVLTVAFLVNAGSSNLTVLGSDELVNLKGAELVSCSGLNTETCGNEPSGFDPEEMNCNKFTATVGGSVSYGGVTISVSIGDEFCKGGCSVICDSDDIKKYCKTTTNSFCDTADEDGCIGGTKYTSPNACFAALASTQGCASCDYNESSNGC